MTAEHLLNISWSAMFDYPKVSYPHRHSVIARRDFINPHGVVYEGRIIANRKQTRWWLELQNQHWLRLYLSTTSKRVLEDWREAFQDGEGK